MNKVVNAIVFHPKEKNKFLVVKRKQGELHGNKWAFPGGNVKTYETEEQALKREIFEETGITIKEIKQKISEYDYKREGKKVHGICFLAITEDSIVKPSKEIQDIRWVTLEELEFLDCIPGIEEEAYIALNYKSIY